MASSIGEHSGATTPRGRLEFLVYRLLLRCLLRNCGIRTSWYSQYCEISPGLKDLPPDECGKNSIHFILSPLQGWREAEVVPLISVEVHMHLAKRHYLRIGGAILVAALTLSAATF